MRRLCLPTLSASLDGGEGRTESDALLEWNDAVQRSPSQQTDKVSTNGNEDKGDVEMQHERRRACDRVRDLECRSGRHEVV